MASPKWLSRERDYEKEQRSLAMQHEVVTNHPLKGTIVTTSFDSKSGKKIKSVKPDTVDPLSNGTFENDAVDPLSMFAAASATTVAKNKSVGNDASNEGEGIQFILDDYALEPWSSKRLGILSKYTTSEKLSIATSFLSDTDKVVIKQQTTVSDKVKHRVEQLDDIEEGSVKEMLNLSQQEYVRKIEQLNQELITAWESEQRVKALKIAIQCAKMLASLEVIPFYPSKFVLITDVLDTFGRLVFERLLRKSAVIVPGTQLLKMLPDNFAPSDVSDVAKETCRNWFYKIASIRELIPRFYVETSILKCYRFLKSSEYDEALVRLTKMIRGMGDPLVATYARCYICRVGILVAPGANNHLRGSLLDFFFTYRQLKTNTVQNNLAKQNVAPSRYLQLYTPALDWVIQCIAFKSSEDVLTEILNRCTKDCNSALILNSIISAFRPSYISARALEFVKIITDCEDAEFPKYQLYRSLGMNVVLEEPPEPQRLQLLNDVWKVVMKLKTPAEYISCADVWVEYPVKYFGKREIDTLLGDILKHLTVDRAFENYYPQLLSILSKVLLGLHDFSVLFSMTNFLPFLDLLQKESVRTDSCRLIMESFYRYQTETTNDPVIVNGLMFVCKTLHDSVSSLTHTDDRRNIGVLITRFIQKIDFGRDFEQQLNFYVESRASFCNLDLVLVSLVQCVNLLSMKTRDIVKGNHTRKTAAFIRACVAYSFITIPSVEDIFNRLNLYLESGKVAFANQALSQGDAFLKAAISLLVEVPKIIEIDNKTKSSEQFLVSYINNFLSFLLVVPDQPEQGVLYLVRGLLNIIEDYNWDPQGDGKIKVYLNVISLLSATTQETYFYHIEKVVSNDGMYGHDKKFIAEVHKIISTVVEEILKYLHSLSSSEVKKRQAQLTLHFFDRIITSADMFSEEMSLLAANLWNLLQKNGQSDTKLMVRTYESVKKTGKTRRPELLLLLEKLPLESRA